MKFFITISIIMAASYLAAPKMQAQRATSPVSYLFIETTDGSRVIPFEGAEMRISEASITVVTPSATTTFAFADVRSFYFHSLPTDNATVNGYFLRVNLDNKGYLHITSSKSLGEIRIFSPTGQLIKQIRSASTEVRLSLTSLQHGIYFVNVHGQTKKIIK